MRTTIDTGGGPAGTLTGEATQHQAVRIKGRRALLRLLDRRARVALRVRPSDVPAGHCGPVRALRRGTLRAASALPLGHVLHLLSRAGSRAQMDAKHMIQAAFAILFVTSSARRPRPAPWSGQWPRRARPGSRRWGSATRRRARVASGASGVVSRSGRGGHGGVASGCVRAVDGRGGGGGCPNLPQRPLRGPGG